MKKTTFKKPTIIWAIDPIQKPANSKSLVSELQMWGKRLNAEILPMAVISEDDLNFRTVVDTVSNSATSIEDAARMAVQDFVDRTAAKSVLPADVLFVNHTSTRKFAAELAKFAEKSGAVLVAANTRAKSTWAPVRLGSFAETLAATCRVPVLLMNPKAKPTQKISSLLFPTDFSKESRNALLRLAPWAQAFNSEVLLFNQVHRPPMYTAFTGRDMLLSHEDSMQETQKAHIDRASRWADLLLEKGVDCSVLVQRQHESIQDEILSLAKKHKVQLIALVNHSAALTQAILGSVVQDVLLHAKCPVLVFYRPKPMVKAKTKTKAKTPRKPTTRSRRRPYPTDSYEQIFFA